MSSNKIKDDLFSAWKFIDQNYDGDISNFAQAFNQAFKALDLIDGLRLMKVEECAGHSIVYAMGWKACIEWLKNGGDSHCFSTDDMTNVRDLTKEQIEDVKKQAEKIKEEQS